MIAGAFLIRFNHAIVSRLVGVRRDADQGLAHRLSDAPEPQVVMGGYGRVGHTIAVLLHASNVPFVAFDTDPKRVAQGRADGHPVLYGDITDAELLAAVHVERPPWLSSRWMITPTRCVRWGFAQQPPMLPSSRGRRTSSRAHSSLMPEPPTPTRRRLKPACAWERPRCGCCRFRPTISMGCSRMCAIGTTNPCSK